VDTLKLLAAIALAALVHFVGMSLWPGFGRTLYATTEEADRQVVERVSEIATKRGVPRAQVALAWVLQKKPVTAPRRIRSFWCARKRRRKTSTAWKLPREF